MTSSLTRPSRLLFTLLASVALLGAGVVDASAATPVVTTTTIAVTGTGLVSGQPTKLKGVVSESPGTGAITGTVTFSDSGTPIGSPVPLTNVNGKMEAVLTTNFNAGGHSLTATYNGDVNNAPSTSAAAALTVAQAATTVAVDASQRTAPGAYRIAGLVKVAKPGVGIPTGTATFTIDGTPTVVALDTNGHAHVDMTFTLGTTHTVTVDYGGDANFTASTASMTFVAEIGGGFTALPSARLLDTRSGAPVAAGGVVHLAVLGVGGIPSSGVSAVVLNVTVTGSSSGGYITAYADGTTRPNASNLNYAKGQTIANLVVAQVGSDGSVALYNGSGGTTHLIADVAGYHSAGQPTAPGAFVSLTSARLLDTRSGSPVAAKGIVHLPVLGVGGIPSSGVSAVVLNVTVTGSSSGGYITAYADGTTRPNASNLNYAKGQTIANLVVAQVGADGSVALYNGSGGTTQLIVDVAGYYLAGTPATSGAFGSLTSARLLDTRSGSPVAAKGIIHLAVLGVGGIPASGVSAVVLNVTVTGSTSGGYITAYPGGTTRPNASNLNYTKGKTIANLVVAQVGADGTVWFYNGSGGTTQIIADVTGYYLQ